MIYKKWTFCDLEPHAIEYSGHGFRYQEPLAKDMENMVEDIIDQIDHACPSGYALFGHSMGGMLAWLTVQKIRGRGYKMPSKIIISACVPPGHLDIKRYKRLEGTEAIIQYVKDYGRVSEKRIQSKTFTKTILPIIQNDYRLLGEFSYKEMDSKDVLDIPIVIICSREDTLMQYEYMDGWHKYGTDVRVYEVPGDHFYLEEAEGKKAVQDIIREEMMDG